MRLGALHSFIRADPGGRDSLPGGVEHGVRDVAGGGAGVLCLLLDAPGDDGPGLRAGRPADPRALLPRSAEDPRHRVWKLRPVAALAHALLADVLVRPDRPRPSDVAPDG